MTNPALQDLVKEAREREQEVPIGEACDFRFERDGGGSFIWAEDDGMLEKYFSPQDLAHLRDLLCSHRTDEEARKEAEDLEKPCTCASCQSVRGEGFYEGRQDDEGQM